MDKRGKNRTPKDTTYFQAYAHLHIVYEISHEFLLRDRENGVSDDIFRRGVSFVVTCGARSPPCVAALAFPAAHAHARDRCWNWKWRG